MAFSACKIPINDGVRADMAALESRIDTFEKMADFLADNAGEFEVAIKIDLTVRAAIVNAISKYDKLNLAIGESVIGESA